MYEQAFAAFIVLLVLCPLALVVGAVLSELDI
jgi:hypothetical protein